MRINLISRLIKKTLHKMSQYFPKPYKPFRGASLKAELDQTDVDKLKTVPVHFSKLNNEVDNEVIKRLCMIN